MAFSFHYKNLAATSVLICSSSVLAAVSQEELKRVEVAINMSQDIMGSILACEDRQLFAEYTASLADAVINHPRIDVTKASAYLRRIKAEAEQVAERLNPGGYAPLHQSDCDKYKRWAKQDMQQYDEFVIKQ